MSRRIWELDALRGLCILAMLGVHLLVDLTDVFRVVTWQLPGGFRLLQQWGGGSFFLLSGCCATLGSRSLRRGLVVLGCGLTVFGVSLAMHLLGLADAGIIIWFGTLQCLGLSMLLWPLFTGWRPLPLALVGSVLAAAGGLLMGLTPVRFPWLIPLGILCPGFVSADYFPLLPFFGIFLLGAALGKGLYGQKRSLLPRWDPRRQPIRLLCWVGRHSLPIYMLHQPVLAGLIVGCLMLFS